MAKKEANEKIGKTNFYLLAIVAIVAIVGVVVLVLNSGSVSVISAGDDLSGEALKAVGGVSPLKAPGIIIFNSAGKNIVSKSTPCCNGCDVAGDEDCSACDDYCD